MTFDYSIYDDYGDDFTLHEIALGWCEITSPSDNELKYDKIFKLLCDAVKAKELPAKIKKTDGIPYPGWLQNFSMRADNSGWYEPPKEDLENTTVKKEDLKGWVERKGLPKRPFLYPELHRQAPANSGVDDQRGHQPLLDGNDLSDLSVDDLCIKLVKGRSFL